MSAEEDYVEAQRRIEKAQEIGSPRVSFSGLSNLTQIPPQIMDLNGLYSLSCRGTKITSLDPILGQKKLHTLDLAGTPINDLGFLLDITRLATLDISNTKVSDLFALGTMAYLGELIIHNVPVTDISPLIALSDLEFLHASGTLITDLDPLSELPRLKLLELGDTRVSNLTTLADLAYLEHLGLRNTPVRDLVPISDSYRLSGLDLNGSQVQDLRPLADLPFNKVSDEKRLPGGLMFQNTPATRHSKELAELSRIETHSKRTRKTLAFLRSLPALPAPLPWATSDEPRSASTPAEGEAAPDSPPNNQLAATSQIAFILRTAAASESLAKIAALQIREALKDVPAAPGRNRLPEAFEIFEHTADVFDHLAAAASPSITPDHRQEDALRARLTELEQTVADLTTQLEEAQDAATRANHALAVAETALAATPHWDSFKATLAPQGANLVVWTAKIGIVTSAVHFLGAHNPVAIRLLDLLGKL